jgi:choline-glycine betaine transporter
MSWEIAIAALAGVVVSYLFRYKVGEPFSLGQYIRYELKAFFKGLIGAAVAIFAWAYVPTVLSWVGVSLDWPALDWKLAAVVGFAGRKLYEMAPQAFTYVAAVFKKKLPGA